VKKNKKPPSRRYLLYVINCHSLFSDYVPGIMGRAMYTDSDLCNEIEILVSCPQEAARAQSQQLNSPLSDSKAILNISIGNTKDGCSGCSSQPRGMTSCIALAQSPDGKPLGGYIRSQVAVPALKNFNGSLSFGSRIVTSKTLNKTLSLRHKLKGNL